MRNRSNHVHGGLLVKPESRWILAVAGLALAASSGGCATEIERSAVKDVPLVAFEESSDETGELNVVDPAAEAEGVTSVIQRDVVLGDDDRAIEETQRIIENDGRVDSVENTFRFEVPVGDIYTIDGLVGQINGRPIYADEFLVPIADRIMRIASDPSIPRPTAVAEIEKLVTMRFRDVVDSELIIAEAESSLSPDMKKGIFGWLQSIQEETIAARGGTRAAAEASIDEEFDITLDEFLEERRTVALAMNLLRKRIEPRTIVSWRDVEQEYRRRWSEFNPPSIMKIGRIRFSRTRQAEEIVEATTLFANGGTFSEAVEAFELPDEGFWLQVEVGSNGLEGTSLSEKIKALLADLPRGQPSAPLEQSAFMSWFTIISTDQPAGRSIYDPGVQLEIEAYLRSVRERQERTRYIGSLRNRWINDDINKMRARLLAIAKDRYIPD